MIGKKYIVGLGKEELFFKICLLIKHNISKASTPQSKMKDIPQEIGLVIHVGYAGHEGSKRLQKKKS